jgi:gluconolactonase
VSEGISRRSFLARGAAISSALSLKSGSQEPVRYPDPNVRLLDPRFARYRIRNTPIRKLYTGTLWAEGPAWDGTGRYLVWSDIPNDRQLRYLAEDGHVSEFRKASGNSNGNTFDREGRQISCEHDNRRVVRYERDGTVTVLASEWQGKPLNAPNDVVVHPEDGAVWFTDPGYGSMGYYEGHKRELQVKEAVYRIDAATGKMEVVTDEPVKPNGLCFSPDYRLLYIADTGASPPNVRVWDVVGGTKLGGGRDFTRKDLAGEGIGSADGIRADVDGNVWAAAGLGGQGFDGVQVFSPDGARIAQILLPEVCANLCFGGEKRNLLFMTASQSLYALYVETRGAHFC